MSLPKTIRSKTLPVTLTPASLVRIDDKISPSFKSSAPPLDKPAIASARLPKIVTLAAEASPPPAAAMATAPVTSKLATCAALICT